MAPRARAPWWIYACAAVFLGYFLLNFGYFEFFGYASIGADTSISAAEPGIVRKVVANSPAEAAGIRPGDRLTSLGGHRLRNAMDAVVALWNLDCSKPVPVELVRDGATIQTTLHVPGRYETATDSQRAARLIWALVSVIQLVLAFFVVFSRPMEPTARIGALFLAAFACEYNPIVVGGAVTWRHLPWPLQAAFFVPDILSNGAWWFLVFLFFAFFPRKVFCRRLTLLLISVPAAIFILISAVAKFGLLFAPERIHLDLPMSQFRTAFLIGLGIAGAYVFAGLACLYWNYRRSDVNERRRIRLLTAGAIISMGAFFAGFPLGTFAPGLWARPDMQILIPTLTLVFPICFAYAIVKHQVFDIRVMVRQGVQYAAARGVLLYLVPVCIGALVLDFALHKDLTVGALMSQRGWPYAALAVIAGIAHVKRQRWMDALDRRFFRERYDAERLLRELAEEVRQARSLDAVAPRVMAQIEAALHTQMAALLVREPRQAQYTALAASPAGVAPPDLDSDSKLLTIFRVLGKPMQVTSSESGWLKQLPSSESSWLTRCGVELLVPVCLGAEGKEAILALGPKRSEEPFSRQDMDLLMTIANSLALLLERPATQAPAGGFEECPQCGNCYDSGVRRCENEGAQLTPMPFLRVLAGRYRLERRLGAGGMGTVYRATDLALEREVALKTLRRELLVHPEAAERFRRESRLSASVSHPNLVAIYDFGIESGMGAFLVMELLIGKTLRQELIQAQRLSAPRALEILRGVCPAVEAAHRRGLVHRDLKPENIFLVRSDIAETPKVLDFGVAKMLAPAAGSALPTADTGEGVLVGTAHYMCPEQLRGEAVDAAWDVWALGVIAYEMLAGVHPFGGTTVASLHAAVLAGNFKPLRGLLPDAPPALDDFFHAALSTDRAQRPATAADFLRRFERSLPTHAHTA